MTISERENPNNDPLDKKVDIAEGEKEYRDMQAAEIMSGKKVGDRAVVIYSGSESISRAKASTAWTIERFMPGNKVLVTRGEGNNKQDIEIDGEEFRKANFEESEEIFDIIHKPLERERTRGLPRSDEERRIRETNKAKFEEFYSDFVGGDYESTRQYIESMLSEEQKVRNGCVDKYNQAAADRIKAREDFKKAEGALKQAEYAFEEATRAFIDAVDKEDKSEEQKIFDEAKEGEREASAKVDRLETEVRKSEDNWQRRKKDLLDQEKDIDRVKGYLESIDRKNIRDILIEGKKDDLLKSMNSGDHNSTRDYLKQKFEGIKDEKEKLRLERLINNLGAPTAEEARAA